MSSHLEQYRGGQPDTGGEPRAQHGKRSAVRDAGEKNPRDFRETTARRILTFGGLRVIYRGG